MTRNSQQRKLSCSPTKIGLVACLLWAVFGCTPTVVPRISPAERAGITQVVVRESYTGLDSGLHEALPESSSTGFLMGSSLGCLGGIIVPYTWFFGGPFITTPVLATALTICGKEVGKVEEPALQLKMIAEIVGTQNFRHQMDTRLQSILAGKQQALETKNTVPPTEKNLEIQSVKITLDSSSPKDALFGCHPVLTSQARWRVINSGDGQELEKRSSTCSTQVSDETFQAWFTNTEQRQVEVTALLESLGRQVAEDLFSESGKACDYSKDQGPEAETVP